MRTRAEIGCEVRDELYALEASMDAQIKAAKAYVDRLSTAKSELGLTGTIGDATIARAQGCVAALEIARAELWESHDEVYTVMKAVNIRGVAIANPVKAADRAERLAG